MRDPAQVKQELVNQWIESAQQDLRLAELALTAEYEGFAQIGFHPLTPYAVRFRYPPRRAPLTRERAQEAVGPARDARELLLARIAARLASGHGETAAEEQP